MQQAFNGGVRFFQYRNKYGERKSIYETSVLLSRVAKNAKACFVVNDHADIAAAVDADGVHLGQDDLPIDLARKLLGKDKLIGISTHNREQAMTAQSAGADYIGFGPIFPTTTKDAGQMQGIQNLSIIKQTVSIPVIAIGGIKHSNIQEVFKCGADGAAVISAILSADNITTAVETMIRLSSDSRRV
jgi:thiamine-phosphate pyrophosphorylase